MLRNTPIPGCMFAMSVGDFLFAADLLLDDPVIRIVAVAVVAGCLAAMVLFYSWLAWRGEREAIRRELNDLFDRWQSYAPTLAVGDVSTRVVLTEYILDAWLAPRLQRMRQAQLFLLNRLLERWTPGPGQVVPIMVHLKTRLAPVVERRLGTAHSPAMLMALDNGIAAVLHMLPGQMPKPALPDGLDGPVDPERILLQVVCGDAPEIGEIDRRLRPMVFRHGRRWLVGMLTETERRNAFQDWPDWANTRDPVLLELVLWKLHEELIGPHALPPDAKLLSGMRLALPVELRSIPVRETLLDSGGNRDPELRVTFLRNPWPEGAPLEISWHTNVAVQAAGALWQTPRLELTKSDACLIFHGQPAPAIAGSSMMATRMASGD